MLRVENCRNRSLRALSREGCLQMQRIRQLAALERRQRERVASRRARHQREHKDKWDA